MLPGAICNTPKSCLKTFAVHRRKKNKYKNLSREQLFATFLKHLINYPLTRDEIKNKLNKYS